jgi:hypothetical protein
VAQGDRDIPAVLQPAVQPARLHPQLCGLGQCNGECSRPL